MLECDGESGVDNKQGGRVEECDLNFEESSSDSDFDLDAMDGGDDDNNIHNQPAHMIHTWVCIILHMRCHKRGWNKSVLNNTHLRWVE